MAGYPPKSLADRLGIKAGDNISILNAPDYYDELIGDWPVGSSVSRDGFDEIYSFMHYFAATEAQLQTDISKLKAHLDKQGILWISWPKLAAGQRTDLNDSTVRHLGLAVGLLDVKVAAIDDKWSGLKFVYRVKDR